MVYDEKFWNKFTENNESNYNEEFAKFIRDLATSLRCQSVLEVGCNIGNDLMLFTDTIDVHGIDLNDNAIKKAKEKHPSFKFQKSAVIEIPYPDASMDFVFTHNVLNYVSDEEIPQAVKELFRVSNKYIINCESFEENESSIEKEDTAAKHRNMLKRWSDFKVKIISHVDMHEEIDPNKPRFTLVKKI